MPKRMYRLTQFMGSDPFQTFWLSDSDSDIKWLEHFKTTLAKESTLTVEEFHFVAQTKYGPV